MNGGRCESRNADGAVNPYLAATLVLAAGLEGIREGIDPGQPQEDNLYELTDEERAARGIEFLPKNLSEAIDAFEADPFVIEALGQELRDEFIKYKRQEWVSYHQTISAWEVERYSHLF
jgi:glutamine synthetase